MYFWQQFSKQILLKFCKNLFLTKRVFVILILSSLQTRQTIFSTNVQSSKFSEGHLHVVNGFKYITFMHKRALNKTITFVISTTTSQTIGQSDNSSEVLIKTLHQNILWKSRHCFVFFFSSLYLILPYISGSCNVY